MRASSLTDINAQQANLGLFSKKQLINSPIKTLLSYLTKTDVPC